MLIDRDGKVLGTDDLSDGLDLGDRYLKGVIFRCLMLNALDISGADLREANFEACDLYWPNFFNSNCCDASFYSSKLYGANFKSACLRRVDFTKASVGIDNLGRASSFAHADLTDANLTEANFIGCEYDAKTIFPSGFSPEDHGMVLVDTKENWLLDNPCKDHY